MAKDIYLTEEGLEKLKFELSQLKKNERNSVIERIKAAKEFGDLSENAEYEDAKNEQAFIESRILELEEKVKHAKIVKKEGNDTIGIGSSVVCMVEKEKENIEIVGSSEADPINGKISSESPVGRALFGRKKGDVVIVHTPSGKLEYKVLSIE